MSPIRSDFRRILSGKRQGVRVPEPGLSSFLYTFAAGCMFAASGLVLYDFISCKLIPDIKSFIRKEKEELCPSCDLRREEK